MKTHDVYSHGVVSSSTLYGIRGEFPEAEGYAEIDAVRYMTGGEATNSSIVLARLGARVKLDGNWLGADDDGRRTRALLSGYGIDTSRLPLKDDYEGVREVVFTAAGTRTIFGTYGRFATGSHWNMPAAEDVQNAKAVCLDPFFGAASLRVAGIAADAGIPAVTVDARYDAPLLARVAAVVVAESFIRENYPEQDLESLFQAYRRAVSGLVIFTFGAGAIWYARPGGDVGTFRPFPIETVDTTGGGDAFRAGIVFGFLRGWPDARMVAFAAAVAALVCMRFPGVLDAPAYDEVESFMRTAGG